jgi:hypothetical protein
MFENVERYYRKHKKQTKHTFEDNFEAPPKRKRAEREDRRRNHDWRRWLEAEEYDDYLS